MEIAITSTPVTIKVMNYTLGKSSVIRTFARFFKWPDNQYLLKKTLV